MLGGEEEERERRGRFRRGLEDGWSAGRWVGDDEVDEVWGVGELEVGSRDLEAKHGCWASLQSGARRR